MLGLRVHQRDAEEAKRMLITCSLLEKRLKIIHDGGYVTFPITGRPETELMESVSGDVVEIEGIPRKYSKETPYQKIKDTLRGRIPEHLLDLLPARWEKYGDVLVFHFPDELRDFSEPIGKAYADMLHCRTVLIDEGGIEGEYREPAARIIFGEGTETTHIENGIRYTFDAARIMFSSGNIDERVRMAHLDCTRETVVDMFAGIGYFSLPIGKYTGAERVYALEKNPTAFHYLVKNTEQNGLDGIVIPLYGDNREFPDERIADRIIMGYVKTTHLFLDKALTILKDRGTVHYHETCPEALFPERPLMRLKEAAERNGREVEIQRIRIIKSYAPGVSHLVVDAVFYPRS